MQSLARTRRGTGGLIQPPEELLGKAREVEADKVQPTDRLFNRKNWRDRRD
jgi:hypothetical protein